MPSDPTPPWQIRPMRPADDRLIAAVIHDVMTEHGCGGAGFAIHDDEVTAMHRSYQVPRAGYFVVARGEAVLGGAGYAQLEGTRERDGVCELRKMYFRPEARGQGLGHAMLTLLLDEPRGGDGTPRLRPLLQPDAVARREDRGEHAARVWSPASSRQTSARRWQSPKQPAPVASGSLGRVLHRARSDAALAFGAGAC